jgi:hypothetical protein
MNFEGALFEKSTLRILRGIFCSRQLSFAVANTQKYKNRDTYLHSQFRKLQGYLCETKLVIPRSKMQFSLLLGNQVKQVNM